MDTKKCEAVLMDFLPKANPVCENICAQEVDLPSVMEKLGKEGFTGYLIYSAADFGSFCIFARGSLICAVSTENQRQKLGFEAIVLMFERIFSSGGMINIYRMPEDLAMCIHALVAGSKIFNGDQVKQVDLKSILGRLKSQAHNAVVRFRTTERYALLFYKNGYPIGSFHDGARAIETSYQESRRVADLPDACLDVSITKTIEELVLHDLLQMVNIGRLWETARMRQVSRCKATILKPERPGVTHQQMENLPELVEDLLELATAYLSKEGRTAVEQLLHQNGGNIILCDNDKREVFLLKVEKEALRLDSYARIDEMIKLMRSEIASRLVA